MIILLLAYIAGVVLVIWPVAAHLADDLPAVGWVDWGLCGFLAVCTGLLWPLVLPFAVSWFLWDRVLRPSRENVENRS